MLKRKRQIKEDEEEEGDSPVAKKRKTSSKGFCQCKKYSKIYLVYQVARRTYMCLHVHEAKFSLVPRPHPAFCHLQYGKVGEDLVSFLTLKCF